MQTETSLRHELLRTRRTLSRQGFIVGFTGNLSVRLLERETLCALSNSRKGLIILESHQILDVTHTELSPLATSDLVQPPVNLESFENRLLDPNGLYGI